MLFFAYFSVSQKRNIKRNPNGMKPSRGSFLEQTQSRRLGVGVKKQTRKPRGREARPKGVCTPPTLVGPSWLHQPTSSSYIYLRTPKPSEEEPKTLFPPPQPSVPVRSHLGAFFGAPPKGASITEGFYINTIASPMMCE